MVGERTGLGISGLVSWNIQRYNAPMDVEPGPGESFSKKDPQQTKVPQNCTEATFWLQHKTPLKLQTD